MHDWKHVFSRPGRIRLYIIHTGNVHMDGNIHLNKKSPVFKTKPRDTRYNPVYCFLIAHPDRGLVLIDTGIHPDFCRKPTGNFGWLLGRIIKIKTHRGGDVISQINSIGLSAQDIEHIVMTHLHPDHSSGLPLFEKCSRCTVYTDIDEYKTATSPFGISRGYLKEHLLGMKIQHFNYTLNLKPFSHVSDFFGDQSLLIIRTPGHTRGHVSVLLNMQAGPLLLTADAAHRHENLAEQVPTVGEYRTSLDTIRRLVEYMNEYPEIRAIYSHDPDQINGLKLFPDYYE